MTKAKYLRNESKHNQSKKKKGKKFERPHSWLPALIMPLENEIFFPFFSQQV